MIGVELDEEVVKIARKWFIFPPDDSRLHVRIGDALDFLVETAKLGLFVRRFSRVVLIDQGVTSGMM